MKYTLILKKYRWKRNWKQFPICNKYSIMPTSENLYFQYLLKYTPNSLNQLVYYDKFHGRRPSKITQVSEKEKTSRNNCPQLYAKITTGKAESPQHKRSNKHFKYSSMQITSKFAKGWKNTRKRDRCNRIA